MPESGVVKYLVKIKFEVDGVVEKADLIGAIFGQTEGLFGPEMNLNELQKTWKVGRIEIEPRSKNGRTHGEVLIPMSTDINTAALVAAGVESVEKVGPCSAHFKLTAIEDVRAVKRKAIVERAKLIVRDWASKTASEGEEYLKDVMESSRRARIVTFGRDELPAGPGIYTLGTVFVVEGRADVAALLRAGIENVVAMEGTKIPDSIARLSREKKMIAFLDGDRGGDLILKELSQLADVQKVIRAPQGREVEDLTPVEILDIIRTEVSEPPVVSKTRPVPSSPLIEKAKELYPDLNGTLEGIILDESLSTLDRIPVNELVSKIESTPSAQYVVFDGIVTQRLVDSAVKNGLKGVIGHRTGEVSRHPKEFTIATFRSIGAE